MQGKHVAVGLLVLLSLAIGTVFWIGMTGGSNHVPAGAPGVGFAKNPRAPGDEDTSGATPPPKATSAGQGASRTVIDKRLRDETRQRILAAWAGQADPVPSAAPSASSASRAPATDELVPMPEHDGKIDPDYIRDVFRSDFVPLAGKCYEGLLAERDAGGMMGLRFEIVGDESVGGIVESVEIESDGGLDDPKLVECMRESMLAMTFRPPPRGGRVTVTYPMELWPDPPSER